MTSPKPPICKASSQIIDAWLSDIRPPAGERERKRKHEQTMSSSSSPTRTSPRRRINKSQTENSISESQSPSRQTHTVAAAASPGIETLPLSESVTIPSRYADALRSGPPTASDLVLTSATSLPAPSESRLSRAKSASSQPLSPRSRSPVKCMLDLRQASPPTEQVSISDAKSNGMMPQSLLDIERKVSVAMRAGFFPSSIRESLRPHIDELDLEDDRLFGDNNCGSMNPHDLLQRVLRIRDRARECEEYKKPEVALGDDVVRPMLELVQELLGRHEDLRVENISTTKISPDNLIQKSAAIDALPLESKKVDYGLYMLPNPSRTRMIELLLASIPDISARTVTQSNTPWLRTKPSLVSVEMKTSVSPEDPLIQLAIWGSAGLQALFNIVDEEIVAPEDIPPSFTVSVKGHNFRVGYLRLESSSDGGLPKRQLLGDRPIGTTEDVAGIFKTLRALAVIVEGSYQLMDNFLETKLLRKIP